MADNIQPGEAYTFANCPILPLGGDIKANGAATYLTFIDNVHGVVKRGGMQRIPAQPTLEELKTMGGGGNN